jgi:hypothetical protein
VRSHLKHKVYYNFHKHSLKWFDEGEKQNEGCERKWLWLKLRCYSSICLRHWGRKWKVSGWIALWLCSESGTSKIQVRSQLVPLNFVSKFRYSTNLIPSYLYLHHVAKFKVVHPMTQAVGMPSSHQGGLGSIIG